MSSEERGFVPVSIPWPGSQDQGSSGDARAIGSCYSPLGKKKKDFMVDIGRGVQALAKIFSEQSDVLRVMG